MVCDSCGVIHHDRELGDSSKQWLAEHTQRAGPHRELVEALDGADVFIGVSGPDLSDASEICRMADDPIVFALANPRPRGATTAAMQHAAVVATGRSDYPNQINNVLAFPGIVRGALDAQAANTTEEMRVAAARAIADVAENDELHPRPHHPHRLRRRRRPPSPAPSPTPSTGSRRHERCNRLQRTVGLALAHETTTAR